MTQFTHDKALPIGHLLEWGKYPYRITKLINADGLGFTYRAKVLSDEAEIKDVVIREFFMARCCYRGDDGAEMLCSDEIESTVADTLTRHAQNLIKRREVSNDFPSLISILDIFEANGTYYHVAECLDQGTLQDLVEKKGPMEPIEARKIMVPIFNAVRHLHASNILHTDICPTHIRFKDGKPVLTHLYAAKQFSADGEEDVSLPTLHVREGYAAPELYGPVENFLPQIDNYSLAATIIFCFTGKHLPSSLVLTEEMLLDFLPKNLSKPMISALFHATITDINERTSSVSVFREELDVNYELLHVKKDSEKKSRFEKWVDKVKNRLVALFPLRKTDTGVNEDFDEDPELNVDEIEASMNEAYPRLIVIGGLTIFVIVALLVSMFLIF